MTRPGVRLALGTVLFLFAGPPALSMVLVPWLLSRFDIEDALFPGARIAGGAALVIGLAIVLLAMVEFVRAGRGTPAPWAAPDRVVTTRLYRWTRNPMYVGVVLVVIGEALVLGDLTVLVWAAVLALAFHLFVVLYEEPTLRRSFGRAYEDYCAQVPRWLIRGPVTETRRRKRRLIGPRGRGGRRPSRGAG